MKSLTTLAVITITSVISFNAMAESKIIKSTIVNKSINKGNSTVSTGIKSLASTGSVNIKDSKVIKSKIINKSINKGNSTVSAGYKSTASTGSVTVE